MTHPQFDKALLSRANFSLLLEKLALKHQTSHRWASSPVVKDLELKKLLLNDQILTDFVLKKMTKNEVVFHPFKKIVIKQENKDREIYIQNWVDKIIQLRIQEVIADTLQAVVSKNVFSFQKGRGPIHAVEAFLHFAQKRKDPIYVLQLDISKYGDNIDHTILYQQLGTHLKLDQNPLLAEHLKKVLSYEIIDGEGKVLRPEKGIPTGSPLVPLFENLYLVPVDQFIEASGPLFYGRYGDDIVIAFETEEKLKEGLLRIKLKIDELKLTIHEHKIRTTKLGENTSFDWLGFRITGERLTTSKSNHLQRIKEEIKNEIHRHFFILRKSDLTQITPGQLKKSLELLEKKIFNKYSNRIFHFYTADIATKEIDEFRIRQTHKALCKNFKLDKREGWKLLRKTAHKSANQERMIFLRKKKWPKLPLKKS